jgi:putative lipoic acid-binding regulatory protein
MTDTSDQKSIDSFRSSLDANYEWPCFFPFKFIVPKAQTEAVLALFDVEPSRAKESSSGRFTAYTMEIEVSSSDEVLAIYDRVTSIPNVISL